MAYTELQEDTKIRASVLNANFQSIKDYASTLVGAVQSSVNAQIEAQNVSVDDKIATINNAVASCVKTSGNQTISGTKTFNGTVKVPNTATTGTAVSTQAISKSGNGYIKFGNGIIIQWGKNTVGTGNTDITLPTAFTSTNYKVTAMDAAFREGTAFRITSGGAYSTTKIRLCGNGQVAAAWLATGY